MAFVVSPKRRGRPSSLTERQIERIRRALEAGLNITEIHRALGIPYSTARDYVIRIEKKSPDLLAEDRGSVAVDAMNDTTSPEAEGNGEPDGGMKNE